MYMHIIHTCTKYYLYILSQQELKNTDRSKVIIQCAYKCIGQIFCLSDPMECPELDNLK